MQLLPDLNLLFSLGQVQNYVLIIRLIPDTATKSMIRQILSMCNTF
jgi:hypothetical protein